MNLEETFDFTNWREHPSNRKYTVFFFADVKQGNFFVNLLIEHKIPYEKHIESDDHKRKFMVGIHNKHLKEARHLNNLTIGNFRNKFMPEKAMRWVVMTISFIALGLAFLGYFLNN